MIPEIGFGTWQLNGAAAQIALKAAVDCGYRLIDTAASYGNEIAVRKALRDIEIPREELLIQGKLWNTKRSFGDAVNACRQSLKRLGLDYFDIYLIHWPASPALYENWREINSECWRAMEVIARDGLAKIIGVCNYLPHHLDELLKTAVIFPAVNQIEFHPGFLNSETIKYCHEKNIIIQAWSPLGEGSLLQNKTINAVAEKYNKTPAQICLRWCVQHGSVPLPKSADSGRIRQNFDIFDFELTGEDMAVIDTMPFSGGAGYDPDTITVYG